jgi:hypothetical protein
MEHLQLFAGKNRSCQNGLARRRHKTMLRQQLQQAWQQQEQQMQAMHEMYEQQQQFGDASWGLPHWQQQQQQQSECVDQQVLLSCNAMAATPACNGMATGADAVLLSGPGTNGGSSRSSTCEAPVLAPDTAPDGSAAVLPQVPAAPADNRSNTLCGITPQALLHLGGNAAMTSAAAAAAAGPCAMPAPVCSGSAVFGADSTGQLQMEQALWAAGAAAAAGVLQVPASISEAELDTIIAEELHAAGLQIRSEATGWPAVMSVEAPRCQLAAAQVPAALTATAFVPTAAAAAAAGVAAPVIMRPLMPEDRAAQYAKLNALMAEMIDLEATLQQLQQAQGQGQQVGSVMTRY